MFNIVAINDPDSAYTCARQEGSVKTAQSAATDNGDAGVEEDFLSCLANRSEEDLPGIPFLVVGSHYIKWYLG